MIDLGSLGSTLLAPLLDPSSRTFLPCLAFSALVALVYTARRSGWRSAWRGLAPELFLHRSSLLDLQLLLVRRLLLVLVAVPGLGLTWWWATTLARLLDRSFGTPELPAVSPLVLSIGYSALLFVAWDASRYVLHRAMHRIPALWAFHQVHHSAEVLTPLTFHRIHPVEGLLYALRGVVVSGSLAALAWWLFRGAAVELTLLGVHGLGLLLNALTGNLRHSHVWLSFGPAIERWLISPAQHQLHHGASREEQNANFGTWLAIWDRMGGTLRTADRPPTAYGLPDAHHAPDDLVGALLAPFRGPGRRALPVTGCLAFAFLGGSAQAAESSDSAPPAESTEEEEETVAALTTRPSPLVQDSTVQEHIVERRHGVPRVAGSAHVIEEEELDRFGYDDVHRVLAEVPGVYVRGEDGFGLRPNIGIRGANSDRSAKVTLLEDGVPLAPAPYAAPAAYYFPLTTRLTGVEVFKGAAATRHGPQTIGGTVNLITRPVPRQTDGAVDLAAGLHSTFRAHGWVGTGNERAGVLAEFARLSSAGFKTLDSGGPTGFAREDLMLKGRLAADAGKRQHELELKLGYGRETSHETYLGLSVADFAENPYRRYVASNLDLMRWQRTQAELAWTVSGEGFRVRTVAWHHGLARAWTKFNRFRGGPDLHDLMMQTDPGGQGAVFLGILRGSEDGVTADQQLMIGTNDRTFHNFGLQSTARHQGWLGSVESRLELGLRLNGNLVRRLHTEHPYEMRDGALVRIDGRTETQVDSLTVAQALAAHVHEDLRFGRLHVLPGMRLEVVRSWAGAPGEGPVDPRWQVVPLPGLSSSLELTSWLDVFAGAHRGFSPSAPGSPPGTLPESAWSYEAGLRATGPDTHVEAVGFVSDYANITGQCTLSGGCDPSRLDQQFNGGRAWVRGLEAVLDQRVWLGELALRGELSYTWTDARFRTGFISGFPQFGVVEQGDLLPYVPAHQTQARLALEHRRFDLSVAANHRSGLHDRAEQQVAPAIPAALLIDAAATVHIGEQLDAYAHVTNAAGAVVLESWRPYGARPAAPRQVMLGLRARL